MFSSVRVLGTAACRRGSALPAVRRICSCVPQQQMAKGSEYTSLLLEKSLLHRNHMNADSASLRCTIFDQSGSPVASSKEVKRATLISEYGLFPRDLRKIDKTNHSVEIAPSISVRRDSVLVNMLHIRCLIKADTVVLFDDMSLRSSRAQSQFIAELESRVTSESDLAYEMRALEAVLVSAIKNLDAEMKVHITVTRGILSELEQDVTSDKLRFLLIQNKKISTFAQKATLVRDAIDELLDNDDDLAGLYLTDKLRNKPRETNDHAEVEMLLESYYKHCDEIVQTVNNSISNVRTTEEIINIILDSNRNQLMLLGLRFSIGLLSLGAGMFTASAYGMNLENFIEEEDYGFPLVILVTVVPIGLLFLYSMKHLRKLQRVTMMGDRYKQ